MSEQRRISLIILLAFGVVAGLAAGPAVCDDGPAEAEHITTSPTQWAEDDPTTQPADDEPTTQVADDEPAEPEAVDLPPVQQIEDVLVVEPPEEEPPEPERLFGMAGQRTENYVIYSQLSAGATADLALRLESMHAYYVEKFADSYFPIEFPKVVVLFNNRESFVAAGGHPFMPGQFMGGHDGNGARLMMIFQEGNIGAFMSSCPLMYHEAFHQFNAIDISQAGNINRAWPTWLDEAYATNFNNLTFTGDGWVDDHAMFAYAASAMDSVGSFMPLRELVTIDGARWHELTNEGRIWAVYMEGWMLVHFLNNGEGGRHRQLLADYVRQISNGLDSTQSLRRIVALQSRFERWFRQSVNLHMTGAKYYEILTRMATSLLARAHARGQRFTSGADFLAKANSGQLNLPGPGQDQWLPDTLRQEMLYHHRMLTESNQAFIFEVVYPAGGGLPTIHVDQPRFGLVMEGSFELDEDGKVLSVDCEYVECPSIDLVKAKQIVGTTD